MPASGRRERKPHECDAHGRGVAAPGAQDRPAPLWTGPPSRNAHRDELEAPSRDHGLQKHQLPEYNNTARRIRRRVYEMREAGVPAVVIAEQLGVSGARVSTLASQYETELNAGRA